MKEKKPYEYAVIRFTPRVEREEFLNIGVLVYAPSWKFLQMKFHFDRRRLRVIATNAEIRETEKHLVAFDHICKGDSDAGPIGLLSLPERFRWLSATRSTIVQLSSVRTGLCFDPAQELLKLYDDLVLPRKHPGITIGK